MLKKKIKNQKKKKFGISAEVYGKYNKMADFNPRVISKSSAQKKSINSILSKNFMFKNLDQKDKNIVIDAMEIKTYQKDDVVI